MGLFATVVPVVLGRGTILYSLPQKECHHFMRAFVHFIVNLYCSDKFLMFDQTTVSHKQKFIRQLGIQTLTTTHHTSHITHHTRQ
jgi:hypothetical protein